MTTHRRARWMLVAVLAALVAVGIPLGPVVSKSVQFREEDREDQEAAEADEAAADGTVGTPVVTREPTISSGGGPGGGGGGRE